MGSKYYFILQNEVKNSLAFMPFERGWGNGYILIPQTHPWYGKGYDDINADVHGGLTLANKVTDPEYVEKEWIKARKVQYSDDMKRVIGEIGWSFFKNYWMIGFDTAHWGDSLTTCNINYVWEQTEVLYEQYLDASRYRKLKKIEENIATGKRNKG